MDYILGTNIYSPHLVPLCRELAELVGESHFRMLLFEKMHNERIGMGWEDISKRPAWLLGPPQDDQSFHELADICMDADVAILGAVPEQIMFSRASTGRMTFILAERILKKKWHQLRMMNPRYARGILRYRHMANKGNMYSLAIGHYCSYDWRRIRAFDDRIYRFGYFVDINEKSPDLKARNQLKVLWAGRLLDWKRVDILIRAVSTVYREPWFDHCLIVGDGPMKSSLKRLSKKLYIPPNKLQYQDPVPIVEIRRLLREYDVLVLTSNRHEGWGAIAGEAMTEGCVLIANEQAGASRTLIQQGKTGFLFPDGNANAVASILIQLGSNPAMRDGVYREAWQYMKEVWSPRAGAERLLHLIQDIRISRSSDRFQSGPCSHFHGGQR